MAVSTRRLNPRKALENLKKLDEQVIRDCFWKWKAERDANIKEKERMEQELSQGKKNGKKKRPKRMNISVPGQSVISMDKPGPGGVTAAADVMGQVPSTLAVAPSVTAIPVVTATPAVTATPVVTATSVVVIPTLVVTATPVVTTPKAKRNRRKKKVTEDVPTPTPTPTPVHDADASYTTSTDIQPELTKCMDSMEALYIDDSDFIMNPELEAEVIHYTGLKEFGDLWNAIEDEGEVADSTQKPSSECSDPEWRKIFQEYYPDL